MWSEVYTQVSTPLTTLVQTLHVVHVMRLPQPDGRWTAEGEQRAESHVSSGIKPQSAFTVSTVISFSSAWLTQEPLQGFLPGLPVWQQIKGLKGPQ